MVRLLQTITRWEWVILLIITPLLLFPTGFRALLILFIPLLWIIRRLTTGHFFVRTPYDVAFLMLMLMVLVSLYAVFDIDLSFGKIAGVVLGLGLFYAAVAHAQVHKNGQFHLLAVIGLAGAAIAMLGVLGIRWSGPFAPINQISALLPATLSSLPGTVGGTVNPNELSGVMNWVVPLLLACLVGFWRPLWRSHKFLLLILLGLTGVTAVALIGALSRGGLMAFAVAILVMLAIRFRWGRWLLAVALIAGISLLFYLDIDTLLAGGADAADTFGLDARLEIWSRALYGLADFPFTGMSMNGFRQVVHLLYPLFSITPDTDFGHAHNHLLQAGVDLGIPGLIAYLAIWFVSVVMLWSAWQQTSANHQARVLIVGLSGSLTAGWLFGLLDAIALGARPGFIWWLLLALLTVVYSSTRPVQIPIIETVAEDLTQPIGQI